MKSSFFVFLLLMNPPLEKNINSPNEENPEIQHLSSIKEFEKQNQKLIKRNSIKDQLNILNQEQDQKKITEILDNMDAI